DGRLVVYHEDEHLPSSVRREPKRMLRSLTSARWQVSARPSVAGQRPVAIARGPGLGKARVCLVRVTRLSFDADAVPARHLIDSIAAPVRTRRVLTRPYGEHYARVLAGGDDDV